MRRKWKTAEKLVHLTFSKKWKAALCAACAKGRKTGKNTKSRKVEKRKTSKSVFSRKVEKSKSGSVREKSKNAKNTKSRKVEKDRFSTFLLFVFFALFLFFYFSIFLLFSLFLFFYFSCEKRRQKMWRLQKPLFFYFLTFWLFSFFSFFFFFSYFSQPKTCTDKKIPNVTSNWLSQVTTRPSAKIAANAKWVLSSLQTSLSKCWTRWLSPPIASLFGRWGQSEKRVDQNRTCNFTDQQYSNKLHTRWSPRTPPPQTKKQMKTTTNIITVYYP